MNRDIGDILEAHPELLALLCAVGHIGLNMPLEHDRHRVEHNLIKDILNDFGMEVRIVRRKESHADDEQ